MHVITIDRFYSNENETLSRFKCDTLRISGVGVGDNKESYSDEKGKSYSSILNTAMTKKGEIAVGSNVEYASTIELGSAPHEIKAKNKKALASKTTLFGKRVFHPGYRGDSFLYWAFKNVDVLKSTADDMKDMSKFMK